MRGRYSGKGQSKSEQCCNCLPTASTGELTLMLDGFPGYSGSKSTAGFLPGREAKAALQQRGIEPRRQTAFLNLFVLAGLAEGMNVEFVSVPDPNFGNFKTAIKFQFVQTAAGKRDFQSQIGVFLCLSDAVGIVGLCARLPRGKPHRRVTSRDDFSPMLLKVNGKQIADPLLN
jgi:hypothetical protein